MNYKLEIIGNILYHVNQIPFTTKAEYDLISDKTIIFCETVGKHNYSKNIIEHYQRICSGIKNNDINILANENLF